MAASHRSLLRQANIWVITNPSEQFCTTDIGAPVGDVGAIMEVCHLALLALDVILRWWMPWKFVMTRWRYFSPNMFRLNFSLMYTVGHFCPRRYQWTNHLNLCPLQQLLKRAFIYPIFLYPPLLLCGTGNSPEITILEILLFNCLPNSLFSFSRIKSLLLPMSFVPMWQQLLAAHPSPWQCSTVALRQAGPWHQGGNTPS